MIGFEAALDILSNETRREILKRLVREPHYGWQLASQLDVSQQAVVKHLNVLEEAGFVNSEKVASEKGGPPKRIYSVKQSFSLRMDLGPDLFRTKHSQLPRGGPLNISNIHGLPDTAIQIATHIGGRRRLAISEAAECITHIQEMLDRLDDQRNALVALHQHVMKRVSRSVEGEFEDYQERSIVHTILEDPRRPVDLDAMAVAMAPMELNMEAVMNGIIPRIGIMDQDTFLPVTNNTPLPWWLVQR